MSGEYHEADTRRCFEYEKPASGAVVSLWGMSKPTLTAVTIPDKTPSFVFKAPFNKRPAGYYVVRWRVKVLKNVSIPNGLRFSVRVIYDAEEDMTGSFDMIMPHEELMALDPTPEKGGTFDLELEELVVVQPYQHINQHNKRQSSTVVVAMSNCESVDHKYSGLEVQHVELSPFTQSPPIICKLLLPTSSYSHSTSSYSHSTSSYNHLTTSYSFSTYRRRYQTHCQKSSQAQVHHQCHGTAYQQR
ncbi:MAG: hypothetical protein J3Q66DRAFT_94381 [Benniella sp.]|nr:MAG: hypothetical protein J3Q66DRAFT_94381 [Benniella sp.]